MDNNNEKEKNAQQMAILQEEEKEDGMRVPNWLVEVLAWITRIEMANSQLSSSCKLFKLLCLPKLHENVKPHEIKKLEFCSTCLLTNSGNPRQVPIPTVDTPSYILGFQRIHISFLDDQFLEFIQKILPRLNPVHFSVYVESFGWMRDERQNNAARRLLDLLANKIVKCDLFSHYEHVFKFNQLFPGFLQKLHCLRACPNPIPADYAVLFDWLTMPPTNAGIQQKILQLGGDKHEINKFIDRIKEAFSNATAPINFFIVFQVNFDFAHFNMENGETGEILMVTEQMGLMQIVRCPKGEENRWIEEGQNKIDWSREDEDENPRTFISYFAV